MLHVECVGSVWVCVSAENIKLTPTHTSSFFLRDHTVYIHRACMKYYSEITGAYKPWCKWITRLGLGLQ